jgi:ribosome biogenesis GTPase A
MHSNVNLMKKRLKNMDVIIEMRDARAPFSSKNDDLEFKDKKRIILFNKSDLANHNYEKKVEEYFSEDHVLFTRYVIPSFS